MPRSQQESATRYLPMLRPGWPDAPLACACMLARVTALATAAAAAAAWARPFPPPPPRPQQTLALPPHSAHDSSAPIAPTYTTRTHHLHRPVQPATTFPFVLPQLPRPACRSPTLALPCSCPRPPPCRTTPPARPATWAPPASAAAWAALAAPWRPCSRPTTCTGAAPAAPLELGLERTAWPWAWGRHLGRTQGAAAGRRTWPTSPAGRSRTWRQSASCGVRACLPVHARTCLDPHAPLHACMLYSPMAHPHASWFMRHMPARLQGRM